MKIKAAQKPQAKPTTATFRCFDCGRRVVMGQSERGPLLLHPAPHCPTFTALKPEDVEKYVTTCRG